MNTSQPFDFGLSGPILPNICSASMFLVFMSHVEEMINSSENISRKCERIRPIEIPDEEYDFVVIGGGAGGAVVSARLSEISDKKVLLIEAGPDEPAIADVPFLYRALTGSSVEWNYTTTNERNGCLSTSGSCPWPTGRMLGGSTSHNAMKYVRGVPKDYEIWADLGNEGWTWEEVKPFFLLAEDNREIERVGRKHHATGGPLSVERFPHVPDIGYSLLAASIEAGFEVSEDLNGDQITGFTNSQTTSKNGVRRSSAASYLRPARNRKNLHVSVNSIATRVMIENERAVGVEYYKNGERKTVRATEEVILSAGSMKSPHILLHSGIGPKEHLESVGVKVVKDLPGVGENLHDHVGTTIRFTFNDTDTYDINYENLNEYVTNQTGLLSSSGYSLIMATLATNITSPELPDIQLYFRDNPMFCSPGDNSTLRSTGPRIINVRVVNLHPKSKGRVRLASNDPFETPVLWGNFLNESIDVERLIRGIEMTLSLADTKTMQKHNFTLPNLPLTVCSQHVFRSPEYWACTIKYDSVSENHVVGSCKMGPASDPMAVVDPQLRVHGIKGLRVVDASVMPEVTSGNTATPTMMIGERAARFIKNDLHQKIESRKASTHDCGLEYPKMKWFVNSHHD